MDTLARTVIRGDYGNGEERKKRLGANYAAVQRRVHELFNGAARRRLLPPSRSRAALLESPRCPLL